MLNVLVKGFCEGGGVGVLCYFCWFMIVDVCDDDVFNVLFVGICFGELEIFGILGVGGFGIVYLVCDYLLECEVVIKEYMFS